jgi:hypothetical protein
LAEIFAYVQYRNKELIPKKNLKTFIYDEKTPALYICFAGKVSTVPYLENESFFF